MTDAEQIDRLAADARQWRRQRAILDSGRAKAHKGAKETRARNERTVRRALLQDQLSGRDVRGRGSRIERAVKGEMSGRTARRILARFSNVSEPAELTVYHDSGVRDISEC